MRPRYLVSLAIGLLLVYLSIYGFAGFGIPLSWSSSTLPMREDFNDDISWQKYSAGGGVAPTIHPAGQLEMTAGTGTGDTRSSATSGAPAGAVGNGASYTLTIAVNFTGTVTHGRLSMNFRSSGTVGWWDVVINQTHMSTGTSGSTSPWAVTLAQDSSFYTYTFCVTQSSNQASMDIYRGATLLKSGALGSTNTVWQPQLSLDTSDSAVVHVDYVDFKAGLIPPTAPTGTLTVNTNYLSGTYTPLSGVPVSADSVPDQPTVSGTTAFTLATGSVPISVPQTFSSYTFSAWSDSGARAHSVTVTSSGLTVTATYAPTATYSLTVYAQSGGSYIAGMSVTVNGGSPQTVTTSGVSFGPYTSSSATAVIAQTYGEYTFSSWQGDGTSNTRSDTLSAGSNTWIALYTYTPSDTYSLKIYAQCNGAAISGMSATVNGAAKQITTSGTDWGPYTSSSVTASIDQTSGSYTFSYWSVNGQNVGSTPPTTLNAGGNTWTAIYTQGGSTTYTLTIKAQYNGGAISGMNAMVNSQTKAIASSGTDWGPYTSSAVTATIDGTFGSYVFSYWSINGANYGANPPTTLNVGGNTWTAVYTTSSPPVDILTELWNKLIAWLKSMQENRTVQMGELGVGGLLTVVSIIGFAWPGKKPFIVLPAGLSHA